MFGYICLYLFVGFIFSITSYGFMVSKMIKEKDDKGKDAYMFFSTNPALFFYMCIVYCTFAYPIIIFGWIARKWS